MFGGLPLHKSEAPRRRQRSAHPRPNLKGNSQKFAVTDRTELAGQIIERTGNRFVTGPDGARKGTFKSLKEATAALARVEGVR